MQAEQIDLFMLDDPAPNSSGIIAMGEPVLNGFYYEERSRQFVSFVQGRRHFKIEASKCKGSDWPREWKEKIMRERSI